jgi:hypothetical protein
MVNLIQDFFNSLNEEINYCHWKSIDRMEEVMNGDTDIDILINQNQITTFNKILNKYNAISVRPRLWMDYPSMEDYLIYDEALGKFYHIHLHYRLIMGKKNAKEYILPLEKIYFKNSIIHNKYNTLVIKPEVDLIMLHLRYAVKYSLIQKKYQEFKKNKTSEVKEMEFLTKQCNDNELLLKAKEVDDALNTGNLLFNYFKKGYYKSPLKNISKIQKLKRGIKLFKRIGTIELFLTRKIRKYLNLYAALGRNNAKHPVQGGLTIALVGCDGSGKTTITDQVIKELRLKVSARKYYLGFNARSFSFRTKILAFISYLPRSAKFIFKNEFGGKINIFGQMIIEYGGYLDRKKLYKKSLRDKANGMIGFYERFPLKNTIDYPQCFFYEKDLLIIEKSNFLMKMKNKIERKYETFKPADINLFINTPTNVIRERREMDDKTFDKVCFKYNRVKKYVDNSKCFVNIDGNRALDKVIKEVKGIIFKELC